MTTLQFNDFAVRFDAAGHAERPTPQQRVVRWMRRRRNQAMLRQMEPRLLLDAGLTPPEVTPIAAFTINHYSLWGAAGSATHG